MIKIIMGVLMFASITAQAESFGIDEAVEGMKYYDCAFKGAAIAELEKNHSAVIERLGSIAVKAKSALEAASIAVHDPKVSKSEGRHWWRYVYNSNYTLSEIECN